MPTTFVNSTGDAKQHADVRKGRPDRTELSFFLVFPVPTFLLFFQPPSYRGGGGSYYSSREERGPSRPTPQPQYYRPRKEDETNLVHASTYHPPLAPQAIRRFSKPISSSGSRLSSFSTGILTGSRDRAGASHRFSSSLRPKSSSASRTRFVERKQPAPVRTFHHRRPAGHRRTSFRRPVISKPQKPVLVFETPARQHQTRVFEPKVTVAPQRSLFVRVPTAAATKSSFGSPSSSFASSSATFGAPPSKFSSSTTFGAPPSKFSSSSSFPGSSTSTFGTSGSRGGRLTFPQRHRQPEEGEETPFGAPPSKFSSSSSSPGSSTSTFGTSGSRGGRVTFPQRHRQPEEGEETTYRQYGPGLTSFTRSAHKNSYSIDTGASRSTFTIYSRRR